MPSYPYALTIVNPGAELGSPTGWTNITGTLRAVQSNADGTLPLSGSWYFFAGPSASSRAQQDVALPPDVLADVDAGTCQARFVGHQAGGTDTDEGWLSFTCLDAAGDQVGTVASMLPARGAPKIWWRRELVAPVPAGTRTLRLGVHGTRKSGTNLDAYWDDFELALLHTPPPPDDPPYPGHPALDLWLSTTSLYHMTDGDKVSGWRDDGPHGLLLSPATSPASPTYRRHGTLGLGGIPTVESGTGVALEGGAALNYQGRGGLTILALVHPSINTFVSGAIVARDASGNRGWSLGITGTGNAEFIISGSATTRVQRQSTLLDLRGMPAVLRARYNGATGEQSIWVNGVPMNGAIDGAVPTTIGGAGPNLRVLSNGYNSAFIGQIAELLVFNAALSDAEAQAFEEELIKRAGLYVFKEVETSPNVSAHQGHATDGTNHWLIDTKRIDRRDASWNLVARNSTPLAGLSGLDHLGDGAYHAGKLYAPVEIQTAPFNAHILVFDGVTLAREAAHDISAQAFEPAALTIDSDRGIIWVGTFQSDWSTLWKYDLTTFAHLGTLTLSQPVPHMQGIACNRADGSLWVVSGGTTVENGLISRIDTTTGAVRPVYHHRVGTATAEGLDFYGGRLYWLVDGAESIVHVYEVSGVPVPPPPLPVLTPPVILTPAAGASVTARPVRITWTPAASGA